MSASGGSPRLPQRLPADERAPEREERRVDVPPLVIADAEAAELIQPAQPAPVRGAAHSDPRTARMEQLSTTARDQSI